ncbi:hypothetical protein BD289DRAFT_225990 [Coniella lustricola]|uniref:Uncharacterized protein n=1 Tax=Coniella lustricola TaxID=2025994 RepID=A0A2T3AAT6_9PEZI|nr:hypothetical protein BD289DRAFT_225990 [Coniella lustricola]
MLKCHRGSRFDRLIVYPFMCLGMGGSVQFSAYCYTCCTVRTTSTRASFNYSFGIPYLHSSESFVLKFVYYAREKAGWKRALTMVDIPESRTCPLDILYIVLFHIRQRQLQHTQRTKRPGVCSISESVYLREAQLQPIYMCNALRRSLSLANSHQDSCNGFEVAILHFAVIRLNEYAQFKRQIFSQT